VRRASREGSRKERDGQEEEGLSALAQRGGIAAAITAGALGAVYATSWVSSKVPPSPRP